MSGIACFTPELFELLCQLKRHNNREWFARNKTRYEQVVRDPALLFITSVTAGLSRLNPNAGHPLRGSLFRIYRDIRFSPDKRPFKTHVGIQFTRTAGKNVHSPCYYLHLEPEKCFVAAGVWHPDTSTLLQIRTAIVAHRGQWQKVRQNIELEGDKLVRPPRGFDPAHPFIEDLKYKDYVASVDLKDSQVCRSKFTRDFLTACRKLAPLVEFTAKAVSLKR